MRCLIMLLIAKAAAYFFFFSELFLKKRWTHNFLLSLSPLLAAAIIRQKHDASFPTIYRQGHGRKKRYGKRESFKKCHFCWPRNSGNASAWVKGWKKYNIPNGWHSVEVIARQQLLAGEERKLYTQISPEPVVTLPKYFRASSSPKIIKKNSRATHFFHSLYVAGNGWLGCEIFDLLFAWIIRRRILSSTRRLLGISRIHI